MTADRNTATRIPRATFASMVGERIRTDITDGTLKPGAQLNEVELAKSFGVSRGPVREALQRLIQEGLLRSEPHRGVFVPVMSPEDIDDIYLAREALETAAVRQITASAQAPQIYQELDRVVRAMEEAERGDEWDVVASRDLDFHVALVGASGSPRLQRMFTTVIFETRLCLSVLAGAYELTGAYDRRDDLVEEHRQIIELIKEGDTQGAVAVLEKHFSDALVTLRSSHGVTDGSGTGVG